MSFLRISEFIVNSMQSRNRIIINNIVAQKRENTDPVLQIGAEFPDLK